MRYVTRLESAGVEFTNGDQPGVRLSRMIRPVRSEASKRAPPAKDPRGKPQRKRVK